MALQCNVTLSYTAYAAGQNPAPMATVQVYNPNASAVVVTSVNMKAYSLGDPRKQDLAMSPSVPPTGPGMTTSVPALSSITFGPFPIVVASAANVNSFQAVNQSGNLFPVNPQGSQPPQRTVMVGALVYGSDGSINEAGEVGLLVSYTSAPPVSYQGGFLNFSAPNNYATGLIFGVL
jgi:hypothetical protein